MKDKLLEAVLAYLKDIGYDATKDSTTTALELDSLDIVEMLMEMEDELGEEISDDWLTDGMKDWTLERIAEHVANKLGAK